MISKKTDIEMERAKIIKVTRSLVRLKHSLLADIELNETLPDTLADFDLALQAGTMKALHAGLEDILES